MTMVLTLTDLALVWLHLFNCLVVSWANSENFGYCSRFCQTTATWYCSYLDRETKLGYYSSFLGS